MLKRYLVNAWRNLLRNKFYAGLNIVGLAIGLAVGIMILLWVQDELSFDRFHVNAANIYKVNSHIGTGADEQIWEGSPSPIAVQSKRQIPEVVNAVRIVDRWDKTLYTYKDKRLMGQQAAFADPSYFVMFDFPLIKGNKNAPFQDSHSVVLTESMAKKFFGDEDPMGKMILEDGMQSYRVTGVLKDYPQNTTLHYEMIFPMQLQAERFTGNGVWKTIDDDLGDFYYRVFLQLRPGAAPKLAEKKIDEVYTRLRGEDRITNSFTLQPLKDLHLYTADGNSSAMQSVRTFLMVSILILIIACINYVNLSTARSILRSKEVSVRKIIGAKRSQLFAQFVCESALLFLFSAALAYGIISLLMPVYNQISGKQLEFSFTNGNVWLAVLGSLLGCLLVSSIYPALLLSSFNPVQALKGKLSSGVGNAGFRKVLVVTQFVFSAGLIISTIIIGLQMKYVREKDLGYDKEHIFSFNVRDEFFNHFEVARTEFKKIPGVIDVSSSMGNIIGANGSTGDTDWEGKESGRMFVVNTNGVDERFVPLFNIKMAAGRNFTGSKADSAYILLNEAAVKATGIKDPVGKRFQLWQTRGTIIGVMKDFNYQSLKQAVQPEVFFYQPKGYRVFVKTSGRDLANVLSAAQRIWNQYSMGYPFEYSFVNEDYNALYASEQRLGTLFNIFAVVAITISCLGLFGLSTYTAQVKKKEVGIRKVLGASISSITALLAKDFMKLVMISLIVAIPLAGWAMNAWLRDFAYRIHLQWWIFVISGLIAIVIAFLTISYQSVHAAMANPVDSLKEN